MHKIKVAVIYYSSTGTNYQLAQWASEGATKQGADVRILKVKELAPAEAINSNQSWKNHLEATAKIPEVTLDDLEWADVYIFSMPTRYGNLPAQMKQFLDTTGGLWQSGKLANKVVTAMSSAVNPHGGQEETILALYTTMYHWGCVVVAPGYTDPVLYAAGGNPYGTSVAVDLSGKMQTDVSDAVRYQAKRAVTFAQWIQKGSSGNEKEN
ncbi:NAD(P)H:quinone oxidoreductase [Pseudochryseolinea flava]|uniref:NAD(P)H:quinone oxidoreductase, type IV n=1 Tax=Pseudochryseolinea flava TaxID=2059302 RepID=A0A364Y3D1_9BACT|nr:NAD(P)H:quinone oxidoreductase [Pseudochryseolinea flava]RAW00296.1 NAD(P)H:quinone oxidoreductase, type IV [Pseudochryseolinea flava]